MEYITEMTKKQKGAIMRDINCCTAEGWEELGRERLDTTKRVILERRANVRIPSPGPIDYNHQQYLDDVKKREESIGGWNYGVQL